MIPDWAVNIFIQVPTVGAIIILVLALQRGEREDRTARYQQFQEFISQRDQHWRDFFLELTRSWKESIRVFGERLESNTQSIKENQGLLQDHDLQARQFIARNDPAIQSKRRRKVSVKRNRG